MTEKKDYKIEFAPGCFDSFEGTQEELDEMVAEIQKMFTGKTAEEIEAMGRLLDDDDFEDLPDNVKAQLMDFDPDSTTPSKRNLQ